MRQWLCDPSIMCRRHLLGEHVEHHMFAGSINKGTSIQGYLDNNLLEIPILQERHDQLAEEMNRRGMNHKSPLQQINLSNIPECQHNITIDKESALYDLLGRCPHCRKLAEVLI
jgi:hypothetical protein